MANLTIKQENFCLAYIETGNASEAYRQAYDAENMKPETINVKASELLANGKIAVRVGELQEGHKERHNVTVDSLTEMYEDTYKLAEKNKQTASMNGSITGIAKLHGLQSEDRKNERDPIKDMSDDELEKRLAELDEEEERGAAAHPPRTEMPQGQGKPH